MKTNATVTPSNRTKILPVSATRYSRSKVWTACWLAGLTATTFGVQASPLTLATVPAGSGGREPAPNVIVSVDDSGSMGSAGITTLKTALKTTFSATNVPDDRIRLAWQSMNRCVGFPSPSASCLNKNVMKRLSGTHRTNFITWVDTLTHSGGTPSHMMMKGAGDYLSNTGLGVNSPWASVPGTTETPVLACRRSYHIFMTDGGWNSNAAFTSSHVDGNSISVGATGNADGTSRTLGDGSTTYEPTASYANVYKDGWGTTTVSTLSDLAFHYWATDLQPSIDNGVRALIKAPGAEGYPVGSPTPTYSLPEYWNPKNDPATWQHMVTYSIGFTAPATTWTGEPIWNTDTYNTSGDYPGLVQGTKTWPSPLCKAGFSNPDTVGGNTACNGSTGYSARSAYRSSELWHMALNSRGKFVPAPDAASLVSAFQEILNNIISDTDTPLVSISASSSSLRTDSNVYVAEYAGATWAGNIKSYAVAAGTGEVGTTAVWRAAAVGSTPYGLDLLDATGVTNRVVLSHNGTAGISWEWGNLSTPQKALLKTGSDTDADGTNRLNYVRGDRTKEVSAATPGPFRTRASRLGDIVNSNIWFVGKPSGGYSDAAYATFRTANVGRTPMIYVGANDGMLHGFRASDGVEKIAYVPKGVLNKFVSYSSPSYTHKYFVDGQPFSGDADLGGASGWKTLLVSGLGGGGKGYFILDVTNPTNFTTANATTIVRADTTDSTDADLGHIYSPAVVDDGRADKSGQIVKMNNGKWAVVMGNGYNSTNEKPVLIIHFVDGTTPVKIAPSCASSCPGFVGNGNGLSAPRLLDLNSDGKVDVAYAGDLQGNLWKFDLTSATSSSWSVAFSNKPYFVAKSASDVRLPIVSAPYAMLHPKGGIMLAFGTGRNVTDTDPTNTGTTITYPTTGNIDTMWGVWDSSAITVTASSVTIGVPPFSLDVINDGADTTRPTTLVQQTPGSAITDTDPDGKLFFDVSRNGVAYTSDATTKRGWYLDWPVVGLRVLHNPVIFKGERILVQSTVPQSGSAVAGETCTPSSLPEKTFVSVFNMFSGNPSQTQVFTPVDTSIPKGNLGIAQINPGDFSRYIGDGNVRLSGPAGSTNLKTGEGLGLRSNWREYQ